MMNRRLTKTLAVSLAATALLPLAGTLVPARAAAARPSLSARMEQRDWVHFLILLLRALYEMYGGDPDNIPDDKAADGMTAMIDLYDLSGTPSGLSPQQVSDALKDITDIKTTFDGAPSGAVDPTLLSDFLATLNEMAYDLNHY